MNTHSSCETERIAELTSKSLLAAPKPPPRYIEIFGTGEFVAVVESDWNDIDTRVKVETPDINVIFSADPSPFEE